jgi:hypothetical protein
LPAGENGSTRKWAAAGIGAVVIAVAAIVAINIGGSSSQTLGTGGAANGRGPGGVFGGGGGGGRRGGFGFGGAGTISAINGSTITMKTVAGQTVTVHTTGSTEVTTTSNGTVGDIKAGDNVLVRGTTSGSTVTADQITDGRSSSVAGPFGFRGGPANGNVPAPPQGQAGNGNGGFGGGFFGNRGVAGVVKSVNGDSFTLTAEDGSTVTVTTSSSTGVTVVNPSSVSALRVGDQIRVTPASGSTPSSGTITAAAIREGALGGR